MSAQYNNEIVASQNAEQNYTIDVNDLESGASGDEFLTHAQPMSKTNKNSTTKKAFAAFTIVAVIAGIVAAALYCCHGEDNTEVVKSTSVASETAPVVESKPEVAATSTEVAADNSDACFWGTSFVLGYIASNVACAGIVTAILACDDAEHGDDATCDNFYCETCVKTGLWNALTFDFCSIVPLALFWCQPCCACCYEDSNAPCCLTCLYCECEACEECCDWNNECCEGEACGASCACGDDSTAAPVELAAVVKKPTASQIGVQYKKVVVAKKARDDAAAAAGAEVAASAEDDGPQPEPFISEY